MNDLVGIKPLIWPTENLKRLILFYDRILVQSHGWMISSIDLFGNDGDKEYLTQTADCLFERGIISEVPAYHGEFAGENDVQAFGTNMSQAIDHMFQVQREGKADYAKVKALAGFLIQEARFTAAVMRKRWNNPNVYALVGVSDFARRLEDSRNAVVGNVVVRCLPVPDDSTPLEALLDFRDDPDTKEKRRALRRWMSKIASGEADMAELEEEIEWLIDEYAKHLRLYRLKASFTAIQALIRFPLEVLENVVKLKWSKLTDPLFVITKYQIAILEAELNAPGRQVALIVKARDEFGDGVGS